MNIAKALRERFGGKGQSIDEVIRTMEIGGSEEIEALDERVTALEAEIEALDERVTALETPDNPSQEG